MALELIKIFHILSDRDGRDDDDDDDDEPSISSKSTGAQQMKALIRMKHKAASNTDDLIQYFNKKGRESKDPIFTNLLLTQTGLYLGFHVL